jgi:hypothetical protein
MRSTMVTLGVIGVVLISASGRAATIRATAFSEVTHAGTVSDPWPGSAIQLAIAYANGGDVILVKDGIWGVSTPLGNTTGNFTLQGESISATLRFTASGSWTLGTQNSLTNNVKISGLTFDASQSNTGQCPVVINNCVGCVVTGNNVLGVANVNYAALQFFGGASTVISSNTIKAGGPSSGGYQLQINALGVSTLLPVNAGFDVAANYFDSVGLLEIGISDIRIHDNHFVNTTLGNYIGMAFAAPYGGTARNVSITNNMIDGAQMNAATITGLPQDAGGQGTIDGLVITGNVIKSTQSSLAVSTFDQSCLTSCTTITRSYDVVVSNNILQSYWGWSTMELSGGFSGVVENVIAQGNILRGAFGMTNVIHSDETSVKNIANNVL